MVIAPISPASRSHYDSIAPRREVNYSQEADMHNLTIAWIEDDIDVLDPMMTPFRKEGIKIKEYRTYGMAMDHLDEIQQCNLIILDLILPSGKAKMEDEYLGLTFLRNLRKQYEINIPVLILSVVADSEDVVDPSELLALGAHALPKPVRLRDLKSEVLDLLGLPTVV